MAGIKRLSEVTAKARREYDFPALIDRGRSIVRRPFWDDPEDARAWLKDNCGIDRTEGQEVSVYLGVEKVGLVEQMSSWFGNLGIPIAALSGYSSQTYVDDVVADAADQARPAVLIYAGDFDPSGEDIDRDFIERTDVFAKVVRVALNPDQIEEYDLPPEVGKSTDSRAAAFTARHGRLIQVEVDALPPDVLRSLFDEALEEFWDVSQFQASMVQEGRDRAQL